MEASIPEMSSSQVPCCVYESFMSVALQAPRIEIWYMSEGLTLFAERKLSLDFIGSCPEGFLDFSRNLNGCRTFLKHFSHSLSMYVCLCGCHSFFPPRTQRPSCVHGEGWLVCHLIIIPSSTFKEPHPQESGRSVLCLTAVGESFWSQK